MTGNNTVKGNLTIEGTLQSTSQNLFVYRSSGRHKNLSILIG